MRGAAAWAHPRYPSFHKARSDMIYALPISIVAMLGYMFWNTAFKMRKDIDSEE